MQLAVGEPFEYLAADEVVDIGDPSVAAAAARLRAGRADDRDFARAAFESVRDDVRHSWDARDPRVTVSASDVLREGVGLCFGKAHLLTALLRCEGVPAGLCYQRLTEDGRHHQLHGLVAVHLEGSWHRQDPRGNKPGVDAQFSLSGERLAWPVRPELGERDYPEVLARPSEAVIACLRTATTALALCDAGLPSAP